jgi:transposase
MREHGRGQRWLLLRRWKTVRGSKRAELQTLFAANRRWFKALRWQRLPEMEQLGDFRLKHIDGIAAYCDHLVRFGVVESINTTIKAVLRRSRGMRDEETLLLKLKWTTAHPIRSARDLMRFLNIQPLYSNR